MFGRDFQSILDECLNELELGASIEACLARYPKHAERLRPLLSLAQAVRHVPPAKPRPQAQAAAWQRFHQRASDRRLARRRAGFAWLKPVAVTATVLLALVAAGGGTIYTASRSLPDGPLHPIKLATEEARLWFVFDDKEKADILLDQAETRVEEIMALVRDGKPIPDNVLSALRRRTSRAIRLLEGQPQAAEALERARQLARQHEELLVALWENVKPEARSDYAATLATLHNARLRIQGGPEAPRVSLTDLASGILQLSGVAEPSVPGVWRIGGVEVSVDERAFGGQDIAVGRSANVIAARGADGRLRALSLEVGPPARQEQEVVITGTVEEVTEVTEDEMAVQIAGHSVAITQNTLVKLKLQRGKRVEVTVSSVGDRAVAAAVAPLPEEGEEVATLFAYEGTIQGEATVEGETNRWLVSGVAFVVTPATELDAQAGQIATGTRVRVEAQREEDGVIAKRIVVLAAEEPGKEVDLEGVFQGVVAEGRWEVSGIVVESPTEEPPPIGTTVKIRGQRKGVVVAASDVVALHRPDSLDELVNMRGLILEVGDDEWQVGIARVALSRATVISGEPVVGARAIVWGWPSDKGILEAVYIDMLDSRPFLPQFRGPEQ